MSNKFSEEEHERIREQTKENRKDFLDENGLLSRQGLYEYLQWMCAETQNIFHI